jgi:hypothetical protein
VCDADDVDEIKKSEIIATRSAAVADTRQRKKRKGEGLRLFVCFFSGHVAYSPADNNNNDTRERENTIQT